MNKVVPFYWKNVKICQAHGLFHVLCSGVCIALKTSDSCSTSFFHMEMDLTKWVKCFFHGRFVIVRLPVVCAASVDDIICFIHYLNFLCLLLFLFFKGSDIWWHKPLHEFSNKNIWPFFVSRKIWSWPLTLLQPLVVWWSTLMLRTWLLELLTWSWDFFGRSLRSACLPTSRSQAMKVRHLRHQ